MDWSGAALFLLIAVAAAKDWKLLVALSSVAYPPMCCLGCETLQKSVAHDVAAHILP